MIKRLVIKNCLGIEELVLTPGRVTQISGGNEKGKTSILETIEKALFNTKRRAKFVRTGAEKAFIELETDDGMQVFRTVIEDEAGLDNGTVKVTQNGMPVKSPETFLKELFGIAGRKNNVLAFNPVDFMLKKDTEQTDVLLKLLPIQVTMEDCQKWFGESVRVNYEKHGLQVLKDLEQWFYEARREASSRVKAVNDECVAVAKRLPDNYKIEEWETKNLQHLFGELRIAEESNQKITSNREVIFNYASEVERIDNFFLLREKEVRDAEVAELEKIRIEIESGKESLRLQIASIDEHIKRLETERAGLWNELKNMDAMKLAEKKEALRKISDEKLKNVAMGKHERMNALDIQKKQAEEFIKNNMPINTEALNIRCAEVEKMKGYIPLAKEVEGLKSRLMMEAERANHYDNCVKIAREKPQEILSQTELPVSGLGINALGLVTIDDLPISNLSTSKQIRTCIEIAKAIAKNTTLKLILVDKLECLDKDIREEFLTQIEGEEDGYQFVTTCVTEGELKIEGEEG